MSVNDAIRTFIMTELMHEDGRAVLDDDESLLERGILDSLGLLTLLSFLQDQYQVTVHDRDIVPEHFGSVRVISALVERLRQDAVGR